MKRKATYFFIFIAIVSMLIICSNSVVYATDIQITEYSKKYQEWLELSEEERYEKIAPLPYNIRNESKSKTTLKSKVRAVLKTSQIPDKFDLRDKIQIEVKNQKSTGACWAFAANASVETYLALQGQEYDFSERHLEYETSKSFTDEQNPNALNREVGEGGDGITAFTYYARGSGPILEEDMPFEENEDKIKLEELPTNVTIKKVDNMVIFPSIYKEKNSNGEIIYKDADDNLYTYNEILEIRNQIKEHIMNYGGVSTSVYGAEMNSEYYNQNTFAGNVTDVSVEADHGVTIIGWDDNYKKENFINQPTQDGAYIVLNSWGEEYGDNGCYYVSYEDLLIENEMKGVTEVSDIQYDEIYQYDTSEMYGAMKAKYAANIFSTKSDEILKEIVVGSWNEQTCDIYVNTTNGELTEESLTKVASDITLKPGFNTIKLNEGISLEEGNRFSIVVKITSSNYEGIGLECNVDGYFSNAVSNEGESFVSNDGVNWEDIYDANNMMNFSIKAYTQKKEKSLQVEDIKGKIYEEIGGTCRIILSTSYLENNSEVEIEIYKENTELTSEFKILNNKIKGKGAFITIECPNNISQGVYDINININGYDMVVKQFFVLKSDDTNIITVQFDDEILYEYIKEKIKDGISNDIEWKIDTFETEIQKITQIEIEDEQNLENISGIEYFTNLETINLSNNKISNIEPLQNLKKLKTLKLDNCLITDLTPISYLTNLTELSINDCRIETLNPLESIIENLNNLSFERANVRDASVLDKKNSQFSNLSAIENIIYEEIDGEGIVEIEIPTIIKQVMSEQSILYSSEGVSLKGCEWSEVGAKIKINTENSKEASIVVNSGKASSTQYILKSKSQQIKKGDVNQDGKIDTTDLLQILRHMSAEKNNETLQKYPTWLLVENNLQAADINEDGKVDTTDLLNLLRHMAASKSDEIAQKYPEWIIEV